MNCAVIFGGCGFIGLFYAERAIELNLYDKLYLIDIKKPRKINSRTTNKRYSICDRSSWNGQNLFSCRLWCELVCSR